MEIYLKDIKPFVRYAHYFTIGEETKKAFGIPYESRLFYVKKGHSFLEIEGKKYEMREGNAIIINSGTKYRFLAAGETTTYIGINFDYTYDYSYLETPLCLAYSKRTFDNKLIERVNFIDMPMLNDVLFIYRADFLEDELDKILTEYSTKLFLYRTNLSSAFLSVLVKCLREAKNPNNSMQTKKAKSIIEYIQKNYSEDITNEYLSKIFHFHPNYINRIVKESTNFSVHQYVLRVRISKAVSILMQQDISIGEVAYMCGFYDSCHFSKSFKKIMGISPGDFKRRRV